MATIDDEGRRRTGVYLPEELWQWLEEVAMRDGSNRNDLLEGIILNAKDEYEDLRARKAARAAGRPAMFKTGREVPEDCYSAQCGGCGLWMAIPIASKPGVSPGAAHAEVCDRSLIEKAQ